MLRSFMDEEEEEKPEKEWHMLTEFTLTLDDAKAYVYRFSNSRRVHGWKDIDVRLYV